MHTKPMKESDGKFSDEKQVERKCPKCSGPMVYSVWESSCGGYEDMKYRCTNKCGYVFWVEGPDS